MLEVSRDSLHSIERRIVDLKRKIKDAARADDVSTVTQDNAELRRLKAQATALRTTQEEQRP